MVDLDDNSNFETFRDCLSSALVEKVTKSQQKSRRRTKSTSSPVSPEDDDTATDQAEDLADFIDYIASEAYESVPDDLKKLNHYIWAENEDVQIRYALPMTGADVPGILPTLDPTISESLVTYGIIDGLTQGVHEFLAPVLTDYITSLSTRPPAPSSTKAMAKACEICDRDWINLTYHHLIPREVHAKVLKRGWHRKEELNSVAWLCRSCHSMVHRFARNEDLARHYYTVNLLLQQDEVVAFANWVSRVRFKKR